MVDSLEHYQIDMGKLDEVLLAMRNEAVKQFEDRLVDYDSKVKFRKMIDPIFGANKGEVIFTLIEGKLKSVSKTEYYETLQKAIKNYESEVKETNLILVDEVVSLMSSI
jgi:flagellar biosynthesis regulator FlbT